MNEYDPRRSCLDTLLELDGSTIEIGGGFWVSMVVSRVPIDPGRPDGIRYALSLHRPGGDRILGYDNAHAVNVNGGPSNRSSRPRAFDHCHRGTRIVPYDFTSPGDLLQDFWNDVEKTMKEEDTGTDERTPNPSYRDSLT